MMLYTFVYIIKILNEKKETGNVAFRSQDLDKAGI